MSTDPARHHCPGCSGFRTLAGWGECEGLTDAGMAAILEEILMDYARCNFDGRPVYPQDARVIRAFTDTLAAREDGARPGLRWREQLDGYVLEWYCEPPRPQHCFRVTREETVTESGQPVRRVYEIEEIHGAPGSTGGIDSAGPAGPGPAAPAPETAAAPPQGG